MSLAGVLGGIGVLGFYLTAPVLMLEQSLAPVSLGARPTTPTLLFGGKLLGLNDLVWLGRDAEVKCDEWLSGVPAREGLLKHKLPFELSCRCGHRFSRVKLAWEKFLADNPADEMAAEEFARFSRVMTEKIAAVLEWEALRSENPDSPEAWHSLAVYYNNQGAVRRMLECYEKAAALPKVSAEVVEELATVQFMFRPEAANFYKLSDADMVQRSLATYRRALQLAPASFTIARRYAECFFLIRPVPVADGLKAWDAALTLASTEGEKQEALVGCARFAISAGKLGQARAYLNRITLPEYMEQRERMERVWVAKRQLSAQALPGE